jgi:alkylhydroperoxidase/carboxymuconolactone decarboxylase family protein YurZ
MAPNERARKNHDELFPGHVSTLAVTDPELIEIFDNFAFDEVLRHGALDTRTRLMVQLAAIIASQALHEYRVMVGAALNTGVTPVEIKGCGPSTRLPRREYAHLAQILAQCYTRFGHWMPPSWYCPYWPARAASNSLTPWPIPFI